MSKKNDQSATGNAPNSRTKHVHAAIEDGGAAATLVARLHELEARQRAIADEIAGLRPVPRLAPQVVETRLAEWRRLLRQSTTQGRPVLQRILRGRITFTLRADGSGYDFDAPTRFDKLFSGVAVTRPAFVVEGDVRGTEHITDADTTDVDYGELLEKAAGKCLASPAGSTTYSTSGNDGKCLASPTGFAASGARREEDSGGMATYPRLRGTALRRVA
jgi:hypothetical protein